MKELEKLGYKLEVYSGWEGDDGKFFFGKGTTIGWIDVNKKEIHPIHGYYGGYLKPIAKKINYTLIE
jgi:hypothetical protein